MAKLTLDKTYIFWGKFYGPGETEVPYELATWLGQAVSDAPPPLDVPPTTPPARTPRGKKKAADADPE